MWSNGVVVPPPLLDDDLRLFEGVEDLPVEQFVMLLLFDHVCVQELKNLVLHIRVVKQAMFNL